MQIVATIDEHGAATLTSTILNSTTKLDVPDAEGLADDIEATLSVDHPDAFRDTYAVLVDGAGCLVKVGMSGFPIPWQHITSVVSQLRA